MAHDPLEIVLRLRRHAVDEARRGLSASIAAADAAGRAAAAAEQAIHNEAELASDPNGDDRLVEIFAAWLPAARQRALQARAWHERQEAEVARCRADLATSRTALESIEQLQIEQRAKVAADRAKQDQRILDEVGYRPRTPVTTEPS